MTIYVVDLEKIETRYTSQWYDHIPKLLRRHNFNVEVISGPTDIPPATTPGAFLNFGFCGSCLFFRSVCSTC